MFKCVSGLQDSNLRVVHYSLKTGHTVAYSASQTHPVEPTPPRASCINVSSVWPRSRASLCVRYISTVWNFSAGQSFLPSSPSVFPFFLRHILFPLLLLGVFSRRSCIFIESICMAAGSDLFYLSGLTVGNRITISLNGESVLCGP